mgnify:CR=1 FL=1
MAIQWRDGKAQVSQERLGCFFGGDWVVGRLAVRFGNELLGLGRHISWRSQQKAPALPASCKSCYLSSTYGVPARVE